MRRKNELTTKYKAVFDAPQAALLDSVLAFAQKKHEGQTRASGEPYITHPIAVADIVLDMGLDYAAVAAALLHDTVEDTQATEKEIKELFGEEIAALVMGITKLEKYKFASDEEEQAENFRRMYFAMAKDIRVIIIKLADRLHNMRTIDGKSPQKQVEIAVETLEIYAPLASRLGLSYIKCELEDICLRVSEPAAYKQLAEEIPLKRAERQDLVSHIVHRLDNILKELKIDGEVSGRPKHFYSIYKKMIRQKKTFEQIYDLTAVRVVVPEIKDCYEVLGMIHTLWKPIPGRFKDFISVPKPNNYQSLHTTVMTTYGMPFEIQIRTFEMHKVAEYGVAAHWKYKENRLISDDLDNKIGWLRDMISEQEGANPQEFFESLKLDLYSGQVFIFTPKGDVISLPEGSTPVDFAYSVHSEVGARCVGAKVNGKLAPLESKLVTGDYVEIVTAANSKGPSRDWLRFVQSSQAKSKIRAFFKKEMKEENIKRGKQMLEKEAATRGYELPDLMQKKWLDVIMQRYCFSSLDDMYASIGYGGYTVGQILLKLIDFYKKEAGIKKILQKTLPTDNDGGHGVVVMGQDDLLVRMARCCSPVPGDKITGFISRGRGIAIHREGCPNLKNTEPFRLVEARWAEDSKSEFTVALHVETKNTAGVLAKITNIISKENLSIESLNARVDKHNNGVIILMVHLKDTGQIRALTEKLSALAEVEKVYRKQ
ncbi:MAG: bifunctional (p)ppGpp synthetase/guanosine-3',5'-bis(diphosphate) 3'-pyrophosphohydrolase [Firmicutes bacterium]|nr:bifunctional (p)ppGpp synthetase/guanosine-3',5'-bis(diphosphate) 3'-pyrophosphohydrolase [Bacillota bacterium]